MTRGVSSGGCTCEFFFLVCDAELVGACVVAVRRARGVQVDKDLLKPTARVALDMTTLAIVRLLPREVPHPCTSVH